MARTKRTIHQRERERVEINELALRGVPQAQIAKKFGLSQPMIAYELAGIRKRWRAQTATDLNSASATELALLDRVECETWDAYEKSKANGGKRSLRLLKVLLETSDRRVRLLGLSC